MVKKSKELPINHYLTERKPHGICHFCEKQDTKYNVQYDEANDFEQLSINCAPLYRLFYKTNARKVKQMIHGFLQGDTDETWIKTWENKLYGQVNFKALQTRG